MVNHDLFTEHHPMPVQTLQTTSPPLPVSRHAKLFNQEARETAQYIADMVLELRNMAKSDGFSSLQSLLELAYYEAFTVAHKVELPEGEEEYLKSLSADVSKSER
jgi:hypothetical protein